MKGGDPMIPTAREQDEWSSACKFQGTDCDGPGANEMCATCYGYMVGTGDAVKRLREMALNYRGRSVRALLTAADILEREGKGRR